MSVIGVIPIAVLIVLLFFGIGMNARIASLESQDQLIINRGGGGINYSVAEQDFIKKIDINKFVSTVRWALDNNFLIPNQDWDVNIVGNTVFDNNVQINGVLTGGSPLRVEGGVNISDGGLRTRTIKFLAQVDEVGGITRTQPVYLIGTNKGIPLVQVSDMNDFLTVNVIGLAAEDGAFGELIEVVQSGILFDINTSAFNEGDIIYLGNKEITNVAPGRRQGLVEIAEITKSDSIEGEAVLDIENHNLVMSQAESSAFNIVNLSDNVQAGPIFSLFNDSFNRAALLMTTSNPLGPFPDATVLFNEGVGPTIFTNGGPIDFIWRNNVNPALSFDFNIETVMTLKPDGNLQVLGDVNTAESFVSQGFRGITDMNSFLCLCFLKSYWK